MNLKKSIVVLLLGTSALSVQGQATLYFKEKTGTKTSYDMSTIRKLTFSGLNVNVNLKSGSVSSFGIAAVQRMSFVDYDSPLSIFMASKNSSIISLYPNPANDNITVLIESTKTANTQLEIIDLQGKVVFVQNTTTQIGLTSIAIPVSNLNQGSYVCRIQQDGVVNFVKFIK